MIEIISTEDLSVTDEEAREAVETLADYCVETECAVCTLKDVCMKFWVGNRTKPNYPCNWIEK